LREKNRGKEERGSASVFGGREKSMVTGKESKVFRLDRERIGAAARDLSTILYYTGNV